MTLVKAGKIQNILPGVNIPKNDMIIRGFPFGYEIESPMTSSFDRDKIKIALAHQYVWIPGYSYPNAPEEKKFGKRIAGVQNGKWMGYDIVVYGDNHKGFVHLIENTIIFNCGTLMRRKSDEINYKPQIGLLAEDRNVYIHYLDTSKDKYLDNVEEIESELDELDLSAFMQELEKVSQTALDFKEAIQQVLNVKRISKGAKQVILEAME
jgi:predicted phosphodiesterase